MIKIINKSLHLLIILLAHLLINTSIFAQAPQKMSYQAVIRNTSGALVTSTSVGMKISILQGTASGNVAYSEIQTASTNANGLVSLEIGSGTVVSGTFSGINWATGPYFIKTETDPAGGTNYSIIGTNQLLSVPYALFSANGTPGPAGPAGTNGTQGLTGLTGPAGPIGLTGLTGPAGATGAQGLPGTNGATGATGPIGLTGPTGPSGAQGIQGATGLLTSGSAAGNTTYWNGSQWVVNNSNIHNNGAGVGIGTVNPNTSAKLDVESTTQGFLPPRLTTAQRDVIVNPAVGLIIYNTTTNCLNFYVGSGWNETCGTASLPLGVVSTINCGSATITGSLTIGTAASGVSVSVPYTGGNAGTYGAQSVSSTGVVGLSATLVAGSLVNGAGSLTYTITGTPTTSGTASFAITVGGQSCSFTVSVGASIGQYPAGTVNCAAGATAVVDVTNPTTGRIWMDRNLGASQVATSSTDVNSYGDLYQWGRRADGHQCRTSATTSTLSSSDQPAHGNFILAPNAPYDWRSPQNANLWQGVNGVNNPCPSGYRVPTDPELETERLSWSVNTSVGAFASPLKLPMAGNRYSGIGSLYNVGTHGFYWSSTVSGTNSRLLYFNSSFVNIDDDRRADGFSVRCIKDASAIPATLGAINCGSTSITGTLTSGIAASGVSASVPYTGGNGGSYAAQTISSTGVTGLTATLSLGILANGAGSLTYTITGTPTTSGTATFAITLGGQSCAFTVSVSDASSTYPAGTVHCTAGATAVVDVTNPTTGRIWMDRNLGATQVATSSTDVNSYGDLYQWGRRADGHQCRTSATTSTLSSIDQPAHGNFITVINSANFDWRSPQNTNLWQGVNGVNNPCPSGYRIPTEAELDAESLIWSPNNAAGAYASPLKLPVAGYRLGSFGSLGNVGTYGVYWSSTVSGTDSRRLDFGSSNASMNDSSRAYGFSVRCLKE